MSPALASARVRRALGLGDRGDGAVAGAAGDPEGASGAGRAGEARRYTSVAVDSREVEPGALFFALSGERHDGFDFLDEAAGRGALGAVVPRGRELPDLDLEWFPVEAPRRALQRLAAAVRRDSPVRVVGITGSSGKTTVKEMAAEALGGAPGVHRTEGNLNSQVGLPLSVLSAPGEAGTWVLEMGTSAPGEIARLVEIARPDHGVVTTVGPAHLERLGDLDGVLDEKLDLVRGIPDDGVVVVGERPAELPRAARRIRPDVLVAGLGEDADWRPERWSVEAGAVAFESDGVRYRVEAGGEHHLRDAVMAAALADALGVDPGDAARGLRAFRPLGLRGALERLDGLAVVADCYNANPESFDAAVDYCVKAFGDRRRAAAVGSMLELGDRTDEAHRDVARRLLDGGFSPVVATGEFVAAFRDLGHDGGDRVLFAGSPREAGRRLAERLDGGEVVLVKGSRGARLEEALEVLRSEFGRAGRGGGGDDDPARPAPAVRAEGRADGPGGKDGPGAWPGGGS